MIGFYKDITYKGIKVERAYHRIDMTTSSNGRCEASLNIYTLLEAYKNGDGYLEQRIIKYPITYGAKVGSDRNQGYSYILGHPDYQESVIVSEE